MIISTEKFLNLILPTEGYYCAVVFRAGDKHPNQHFTPSLDELVERILVEDANGHTVYHACASYLVPGRRTQDNARCARSLWLDIDVDPVKPNTYRSLEEAERAVGSFPRAGIELPTIAVKSGTGLHCYWRLDKDLKRADWCVLADRFRVVCDDLGILADHSRTHDIASILRPPGTSNRKREPVTVIAHSRD
jgi:hypothetical protein